MRVLLQRSSRGEVRVEGRVVGAIGPGPGLVALVGTRVGDTEELARTLARRTAGMRLFPDEDGRTNLSVRDVGGEILVVSQFTLYADTRKGTRPSFVQAGPPDEAERLIQIFRQVLEEEGVPTAAGIFGAMMEVDFVNDGPFTVLLERNSVG